ncbi:MAG: DUF3782 domain-containing protein [Magnetococcales bacterium]|nr:DUF3782 domain-containing protein [Magnetococcales bacterium]NGZ25871.1 DUF3782 domain-containing protein [Magnetococcales bacterium]
MQEADQRLQETDRIIQETTLQLKETDRIVKETTLQMKETDRRMQETDRQVKEVSKQVGGLSSRWGEFVEGLVEPACETLFAERGIPVHKVSRRIKAKKPGGRHMEIDILVVNTNAVVLVEVKSKLKQEDVIEYVNKLAEFRDFFPEYADKRILGAVAGIVMDPNVDRFAMNQGLFVIVQSGETVVLANEEGFVPRSW